TPRRCSNSLDRVFRDLSRRKVPVGRSRFVQTPVSRRRRRQPQFLNVNRLRGRKHMPVDSSRESSVRQVRGAGTLYSEAAKILVGLARAQYIALMLPSTNSEVSLHRFLQ